MSDRRNFVLFANGVTGSGKTYLTARLGRLFPRRLIFDAMGEMDDVPAALTTWTLAETIRELKRAASRERWTIVAGLQPADTIALLAAIAPPGRDPKQSFTYKVGGIVVEHSEVSLIAPNHAGIDPAIMSMIAFGRHYRISALLAARRPSEVNRIITSQSHVVAAFQQHEPGDVEYLERMTRRGIGDLIAQLREYEHVQWRRGGGLAIIDRNGKARSQ